MYGLKWVHEMAGLDNPTDHPLVRSVLEGARRQLGKPINKKEPVTVEMLQKLVQQFGGSGASLSDIRSLALCLLAFSGFLRYDEIVRCRFSDIKFYEDYMELFIASSKTDKLRNGETLVIAKTRNPTCPVSMLNRYIVMAKEPANAPNWLFRPINAKQQSLREGRLSYTRVRELVLSMLKHVVEDVSGFGVHSLHSGGATAAANAGVSDRHFKRHGRWKSETAKDGYIKDSLETRLQVSQKLGL